MKCLILAAGYGTRMQAVTGAVPKALMQIGTQTILDRLLEQLTAFDAAPTLVTNAHFYPQFVAWRRTTRHGVRILNDGSQRVEDRLGAIGDIRFALATQAWNDDVLIVAADIVVEFSIADMVAEFQRERSVQLAVWHNDDLADQRRRGVVEVDAHGRVTRFEEKPAQPKSHLAAAPLYILPRECLDEPARHLDAGGNPDAPGHLIEYLVQRHPVRAWRTTAPLIDVGNPDAYARALARYQKE